MNNRKRNLRFFLLSLVTTCLLLIANLTHAQEFNYKVNAMYLYYFTKYINWPILPGSNSITIGVLGDSPVKEQLILLVNSRKTEGRTLLVKKIEISEVAKCQMVVISKSQSSSLKQVQEATGKLPILIIVEKQGLLSKGADIGVYIDDEDNFKTKFEISETSIKLRKLQIANDLLQMAEFVK